MLKKLCQFAFIVMIVMSLLTACTASWRNLQPKSNATLTGSTIEGTVIGAASGAAVGGLVGAIPAGVLIGGVSGGFIAHHLAARQTLVSEITANHVQIVLLGDNLRMLLPADSFFAPNTPILNENFYPVLNNIVKLLRGLNKYVVVVSGYTDNVGSSQRNLALSRQQAQAIANYLWRRGINARVLYAQGYGEQQPIASNASATGRALNRRIEITLREITDDRYQ